jgi:hypothetical protein
MSEHSSNKYPDLTEFYRRKEARRKVEAKRPVSEKIATVERLRQLENSLADIRKENKARRAAKQIKIQIKTR